LLGLAFAALAAGILATPAVAQIVPQGLSVTKTVDREIAVIGEEITYTIEVENTGAVTAEDVQVTDSLSKAVELVSISPDSVPCSGATVIGCDLGDIESGGSVTVRIVVRALETGLVQNEAAAYARGIDEVRSVAVTTEVVARPDIVITKNASGRVEQGSDLTYIIAARNTGPGDALNVRIADNLPAGLDIIDLDSDRGLTCNVAAPPIVRNPPDVVCEMERFGEGTEIAIRIVVRVRVEGSVVNTACLTYEGIDPEARPLCATARTVSDGSGFNPPGDALPGGGSGASPTPTRTPSSSQPIGGVAPPTAAPSSGSTPQTGATPQAAPAATSTPPSGTARGSISPPQTGSAGLR